MTRGSSTEKYLPTFTYDEEREFTSYNIMQIIIIHTLQYCTQYKNKTSIYSDFHVILK